MIKLYKRPFSKTLSFSTMSGLLVEKTTLANPPMDASSVKYKLISIVEQIPVGNR